MNISKEKNHPLHRSQTIGKTGTFAEEDDEPFSDSFAST
jgi:hypothetical protein